MLQTLAHNETSIGYGIRKIIYKRCLCYNLLFITVCFSYLTLVVTVVVVVLLAEKPVRLLVGVEVFVAFLRFRRRDSFFADFRFRFFFLLLSLWLSLSSSHSFSASLFLSLSLNLSLLFLYSFSLALTLRRWVHIFSSSPFLLPYLYLQIERMKWNTGGPRYSRFCYSRFWLFTSNLRGT